MKVLFIIESMMYFTCASAIMKQIMSFETTKVRYFVLFMIHLFAILSSCIFNGNIYTGLHTFFPLLQIFTLYFSFKNARFLSVIYSYVLIYSVNCIFTLSILIAGNIHYSDSLYVEIIVVTVVCVLCTILCFSKHKVVIHQVQNWIPLNGKRLLLLLLVVNMILLGLIFDADYYSTSIIWFQFVQKSTLLLVILSLIIVAFLIYVMLSNNYLKQLTQNYEQQIKAQAEHYKHLAESTYEIRRFEHDFKNMSIAIEKLLNDQDYTQVQHLFKQYNQIAWNDHSVSMLFDTGNGIADALLTEKQHRAFSHNSKIVFHGALPSNCLSPTDICVILGNTLDNAIDACEKLRSEHQTIISVTCHCNSGFLFLTITNPISEKIIIDHNHVNTTKKNKTLHGFGLYSLHAIVKKYDGTIDLISTNNTFTVNIELSIIPAKSTGPNEKHTNSCSLLH